ncbi:hypothetical protein TCE0_018f05533 [Talaromyces pinophilus]|uniref:Xylanolytic transcriptional activator regulatory domain-containing protein n=1 Tax=Talaromyces pinophilus TaxID=128442 RepID=A0A510NW00_TALPI|nr:hypothetical protein TCE0_018f05533 [Talaromyces pinophilus]
MTPPSKRRRDEKFRSSAQKREKYTAIACKERMAAVEEQLSTLMEHMKQLANNVQDIRNTQKTQGYEGNTTQSPLPSVMTNTARKDRPARPQFIGPTSSDYNFSMAKNTLRQMGIQSEDLSNQALSLTSPFPSRAQSPEPARQYGVLMDRQVIQHGLEVYKEELHPVYPYLDLDEIRKEVSILFSRHENDPSEMSDRHREIPGIIKLILASVSVLEARGKTAFAQRLVDSVEDETNAILRQSEVSLPDLEILTLTSIYYFHCDEPVLAWRRIGNAARAAIEMGLHRRETLERNFLDVSMQTQALKVFWCIYVLDRRWSFGIGMPFVLHDEDIDPALPTRHCEPYLRCMISYGQICSKVWKAVAGFTDINSINKDTVNYLDFQIQQWLEAIPSSLQLIHPRLGNAAQNQARIPQMLRTFLYIRANQMRIYVHRHHILSPNSIAQNPSAARLVIDIAKDTIHVLVHLRETSTVYETQQVPFNYFLVSAFSAIFLGCVGTFVHSVCAIFDNTSTLEGD